MTQAVFCIAQNVEQTESIVSNLKIYKKDILSSSAISFKFKAMMFGIIHFGKIYDLLYKKILGGKK